MMIDYEDMPKLSSYVPTKNAAVVRVVMSWT